MFGLFTIKIFSFIMSWFPIISTKTTNNNIKFIIDEKKSPLLNQQDIMFQLLQDDYDELKKEVKQYKLTEKTQYVYNKDLLRKWHYIKVRINSFKLQQYEIQGFEPLHNI